MQQQAMRSDPRKRWWECAELCPPFLSSPHIALNMVYSQILNWAPHLFRFDPFRTPFTSFSF